MNNCFLSITTKTLKLSQIHFFYKQFYLFLLFCGHVVSSNFPSIVCSKFTRILLTKNIVTQNWGNNSKKKSCTIDITCVVVAAVGITYIMSSLECIETTRVLSVQQSLCPLRLEIITWKGCLLHCTSTITTMNTDLRRINREYPVNDRLWKFETAVVTDNHVLYHLFRRVQFFVKAAVIS